MRSKLQEVRVDRGRPEYWRITFDNPPFNIFGPQTIPEKHLPVYTGKLGERSK
jgi:hypothetical protein